MSDLFNPIGRNLGSFTGPTLLSGVVADPPRSLLELATGTIVRGTVLGKGPDGVTTVATDKGTVSVATNAQLPTGSAVMLEVRNAGGDRLQVLILSVETPSGRASPAHLPASGPASTGTPSSGGAGSASNQAPAQPSPRPAAPPPIEIIGSSVKAIASMRSGFTTARYGSATKSAAKSTTPRNGCRNCAMASTASAMYQPGLSGSRGGMRAWAMTAAATSAAGTYRMSGFTSDGRSARASPKVANAITT